jgi:hypothetical protein
LLFAPSSAILLDIALWIATVRLIHEAWNDPVFRTACEHLTSSQIHARVASKLRMSKFAAEDGTPIPVVRALEAIGNVPYGTHLGAIGICGVEYLRPSAHSHNRTTRDVQRLALAPKFIHENVLRSELDPFSIAKAILVCAERASHCHDSYA